MSHAFTNLLYHIIFTTKNREPWLDESLRPRLFAYMGALVNEKGGTELAVNGVADHVHLLVRLHQDSGVSAVVRAVKAKASHWVHKTFPDRAYFSWQTGYAAFTVSQSQADRVKLYVASQEAHHARQTFQAELRAFLRAHGLDMTDDHSWE